MAVPENYSKLATIGIAYKGEYDEGTEYKYLNAVYYQGSTYVALIDNPIKPPTNDGINWKYLAEGFDGDAIIPMSQKGEANGVATLGNDTKIPKTQLPTLTSSDVGLGNVPNVATNNQKPTFSQAATRANIASGETLTTIFGKLMKWYADLKGVAFSGNYNDLSGKPTIPTTLPANGGTADKLSTARTLKVNLASTGNATFDGSANQTGIGVAGVLPKVNGGTGNATGDASTLGGKAASAFVLKAGDTMTGALTVKADVRADTLNGFCIGRGDLTDTKISGDLLTYGITNAMSLTDVILKLPGLCCFWITTNTNQTVFNMSLPDTCAANIIIWRNGARGMVIWNSINAELCKFATASFVDNAVKKWQYHNGFNFTTDREANLMTDAQGALSTSENIVATFRNGSNTNFSWCPPWSTGILGCIYDSYTYIVAGATKECVGKAYIGGGGATNYWHKRIATEDDINKLKTSANNIIATKPVAIPTGENQLWVDENGQFIRKYVDGAWQDIVTTNNEEENL